MQGWVEYLPLNGKECQLYLPPQARQEPVPWAVVLAGAPQEWLLPLAELLEQGVAEGRCRPAALAGFGPVDWGREHTPWPAPALRKNSPDFGGQAGAMLDFLQGGLVPELERLYPLQTGPRGRMLLGYSLGGLTALWCLYQTNAFGRVASCSGSLWYDGWLAYMQAHHPPQGSSVYLSLGIGEQRTRSKRMAQVGPNTLAAEQLLRQDPNVERSILLLQPGGHFDQIPERMAQALFWMNGTPDENKE